MIYYTSDGSDPTTGSTPYSGSITVSSTIKLKAIDVPVGYTQSTISEVTYNIANAPVISFGTGSNANLVTITDTTPGAVVYYTTDGSTPSTSSALYSSSFTLTRTTTVNAFATAATYIDSPVATGTYTSLPSTPTVTVTPSSSSVTTAQALTVTLAVSGGSGNPTPTGSVTLTGGGYASAATNLSSGSATINIPAGSLATGTDTLTASYSGDGNYSAATGTASVTVTIPGLTISGTALTIFPGTTTGNTSTITVTPSGGFTGSVALMASVTSSPSGAQYPPTFSFGSTSPVSITSASAGTATLTVYTTAPSSASLVLPKRPGVPWYAAGGAALACLLLLGIPARRRSWRTMLGMLVFLVALTGGVLACGGGGGGGGGGGTSNPGTTAGTYTITVTGTSGSTTSTGTVTLTVQ